MKKIFSAIAKAIKTALRYILKSGEWLQHAFHGDWEGWGGNDESTSADASQPQPSGPSLASKAIDAAATVGGTALNVTGTVASAALSTVGTVANAVAALTPKVNIGGGGEGALPTPSPHDMNPAIATLGHAMAGLKNTEHLARRYPEVVAWMFASTQPEGRDKVELDGLRPHVREWLTSLDDGELKLLRLAGARKTIAHIKGQIEIEGLAPVPEPRAERKPKTEAEIAYLDKLRSRMETAGIVPKPATEEVHEMRVRTA